MKTLVAVTAAAVLVGLTAAPAGAAPADLNPSFGSQGTVTLPAAAGIADSSAVDTNGNIFVAGAVPDAGKGVDPTVTEYNPSGSAVIAFGSGGVGTATLGHSAAPVAIAVGPSGRVDELTDEFSAPSATQTTPTAGVASVVQFTPTGAVDTSFGTGGHTDLSTTSELVQGLAVDPTGRIYVVGSQAPGSDGAGTPFVQRLTPAGVPDPTFGTNGVVAWAGPASATAVGIGLGATVLVADINTSSATIRRFLATGTLDSTYGSGGVSSIPLPAPLLADTLLPQPDGSVVLVGSVGPFPGVVKVNPTGKLAADFGVGGVSQINTVGGGEAGGADGPAGTILVGGVSGLGPWVGRLKADGSPDRTFAADGRALVDTGMLPLGNVAATAAGGIVFSGLELPTAASSSAPALQGALAETRGGSVPAIAPANTTGRVAGPDRIATAIALSQATFDAPSGDNPNLLGAGGVVVADADNFPDALVGAPLAAAIDAPLLLTHPDALDPRDLTEIQRVLGPPASLAGDTKPPEVIILGGTAAVSAAVADAITNAGYLVTRIAGDNRFQTAVDVATQLKPSTVLLATGTDFPDGVTAGAAAAHVVGAVLLTNGDSQPPETADYLASAHPQVYAVGGPAAAADPGAKAIVGPDRYATASGVATTFFPTPSGVAVATGAAFADALAGGARAGLLGEPVLLTAPSSLPPATSIYLTNLKDWIDSAEVYGGTLAVTEPVVAAVQSAIT